jgi:simple sugar transport system permease protein
MEGLMNAGGFFAWVFAGWTGSVFLGTAISAAAAFILVLCFARLVQVSGANPFIAGLALNIACGGLADALSAQWFGTKGVLRNQALSGQTDKPLPWIALALAAAAVVTLFVNHSRWGMRLRACGLEEEAARERGLRPDRYRELSWAAAAAFAVLAGAALTFHVGAYTPGGAGGRGWISLAAVYLGAKHPLGVAAAAIVFSLAERLLVSLQKDAVIPPTLLLGIPYALALTFYVISQWKATARSFRP